MAGIDTDTVEGNRYEVLSLTQNCLESVTNNFKRYHNAFLSSEDSTIQQNLSFLGKLMSPFFF